MEAGEYGLTRGMCFVARPLEVVAVAGQLWIFGVFWVRREFVFFSSNAHGLSCWKYEAALPLSTLY